MWKERVASVELLHKIWTAQPVTGRYTLATSRKYVAGSKAVFAFRMLGAYSAQPLVCRMCQDLSLSPVQSVGTGCTRQ